MSKSIFHSISRAYQTFAAIALGTVILAVVLNAGFAVLFWAVDSAERKGDPVTKKYGEAAYASLYPNMSREEVKALLRETWKRSQQYEPFTQFGERPFQGKYVNVDPVGYRLTRDQAPWPPPPDALNVFVFGGSTTFGYGVADWQTVPSFLQEYLRAHSPKKVNVYNFGQGMYFSSQERAYFEKLLLAGHVPDVAVFIDGLNDFAFHYGLGHTSRLTALFNQRRPTELRRTIDSLSIVRAARAAANRLGKYVGGEPEVQNKKPKKAAYDTDTVTKKAIDRYLENKRLIEIVARGYNVRPVFVWQPVPTYRYDLRYHVFSKIRGGFERGGNRFAGPGYKYFAQRLRTQPLGSNFIWCADIQKDSAEALYVDMVHYSAEMSRHFARALGLTMLARGFVPANPMIESDNLPLLCGMDERGR